MRHKYSTIFKCREKTLALCLEHAFYAQKVKGRRKKY